MPATYTLRPPFSEHGTYFARYVGLVPDGDVIAFLTEQADVLATLLHDLPDELEEHRYAPDKWTIKEVLGHMIDTERIFAYRALCIGRGEAQPLPGFEQDGYVRGATFNERSLQDLLDEFRAVRAATLYLFRSFSDAAMQRMGTASSTPLSTRALVYMVAGHAQHHLHILQERYLATA